MGHREDLLEGAKRCLIERGYSNTSARDIVAVSNTNLGSIGYHYGTKDKLLLRAMVELSGEVAEEVMAVDAQAEGAHERLRAFWEGMIASFRQRPELWRANLEILSRSLHDEELRSELAKNQERARVGLGVHFAPGDADSERAAGAVQLALIMGVMTQHLVDPDRAPGPDAIVDALHAIAAAN
jgi:AcrR family transcriptional regulator